jgi:chemotaxis protein MotB
MLTIRIAGCLAGTLVASAGCVPQERYDSLMTSYRTLQEKNVQVSSDLEAERNNVAMLRDRLDATTGRINSLTGDNNRLQGDVARLAGEYDALIDRLNNMEIGPLPEDIDEALRALAAQHPNLLTYDPRFGMVRFASDFTFDLGSTDLSSEAVQSLNALAGVFNTPTATTFEARIVGHTDNVPIGPSRSKHPTNLHLSVHRAIAVQNTLVSAGVDPRRIAVAGYGEYRPRVPNGTKGAAENRRVEIFLVPMKNVIDMGTTTATVPGGSADDDPLK